MDSNLLEAIMKKIQFVLILFICVTLVPQWAFAKRENSGNYFQKVGEVQGRALMSGLSFPSEVVLTPAREIKKHPKAWPFTVLPRMMMNMGVRITSAAYDAFFYPFVAPFTDDVTPLTENMGLKDYAHQGSETDGPL